jgi:hypothetical protein
MSKGGWHQLFNRKPLATKFHHVVTQFSITEAEESVSQTLYPWCRICVRPPTPPFCGREEEA